MIFVLEYIKTIPNKLDGDFMRKFNVNGTCIPKMHYMVDTTNKLEQIKKMVDDREYFTINRGRQYGKTTTLILLRHFLADEYTVISTSFEGFDAEEFANAKKFCQKFLGRIYDALQFTSMPAVEIEQWKNPDVADFDDLGRHITKMCRNKKIVLLVDEVDKSSNNRVFLGFLSKLREKYLARAAEMDFTFHSVILAGVYDIKNIKLRLVQEGLHNPSVTETTINNSPWNIAADFDVDMSFLAIEIETMLTEYENDHQTGMDVTAIAKEIYDYTDGYPVLVSNICKKIDEKLDKDWTTKTVRRAVKMILTEESPLFDSLIKNLESNEGLRNLIYDVLLVGNRWSYTFSNPTVGLGVRYGYFKNDNSRLLISNKIFELRITDYFVNREQMLRLKSPVPSQLQTSIIKDDKFDMQICLERFAKYYHEHYSDKKVKFVEKECRYFFLFFLNSILNGRGFAHIESAFTDDRRMDVVINFLDEQYVIELKIWKGDAYIDKGHTQLLGYMDKKSLDTGYMLIFDFNVNKKPRQEWITLNDGRKIFEVQI